MKYVRKQTFQANWKEKENENLRKGGATFRSTQQSNMQCIGNEIHSTLDAISRSFCEIDAMSKLHTPNSVLIQLGFDQTKFSIEC